MKILRIGLAGLGTIGGGVVAVLRANQQSLAGRSGCQLRLDAVAERSEENIAAQEFDTTVRVYTDCMALADDPDIDVVIELMGGLEVPKRFIRRALENGKHVVTANKALLAEDGEALFELAARQGVALRYEASVAGGIPVVQCLRESLAGNTIVSIQGILNGTSNYILSDMFMQGSTFNHALSKAQELGYAEADPTLDIAGHDAAHKLIILIRLAWGLEYPYATLPVQGIQGVETIDFDCAREFGYRIKLLGQARMVDGKLEAGVFPTLVPEASLLATVEGSYNALLIEGNAVGQLFMHGRGAGSLPTASAVVADLVAQARLLHAGNRVAESDNTGFVQARFEPARILPTDEALSPWYIRVTVPDSPGVLRDVAAALAAENISVAQAIQQSTREGGVPLVIKTHQASYAGIKLAVAAMQAKGLFVAPPACYRIAE